jgi:hypothetical protein
MRRLAGLAFIGAAAVAAGAFAGLGGLDRVVNDAANSLPNGTAAGTACFDYNGALLPGRSRPWLQPLLLASVPGVPAAFGKSSCMPGTYLYDDRLAEDTDGTFFLSGVRLGADGCPLDMLDVYRKLMVVHPQMGGSVGHRLTAEELELLGMTTDDRNYYADATIRTRADWNAEELLRTGSMDGLLTWYRSLDLHRLPPIPDAIAKGLREAPCTATSNPAPQASPTASSRASPTATPERRTYTVTVSGYEVVDIKRPDNANASVTASARFTYHLKGTFTIIKDRRLWKLFSAKTTSADIQVTVSLSPSECWTKSKQATRYFARLRQTKSLNGLVSSYGDGSWDVKLIWGHLRPGVRVDAVVSADAQCGGSGYSVPYDFESSLFFNWLNDELLEVQGQDRFETTGGVSDHGKRVVNYTIRVVRQKS